MNILITGGNGFIGSYLANKLSKEHMVLVIDNNYRNSKIEIDKTVEFIHGNIKDYNLINHIVKSKNIGVVIHLAGISQVITSINNPNLTWDYNVIGTKNVAEACSNNNVKLMFASSREVYGNQDVLPVRIDAKLNPSNPYAQSKVVAEAIVKAYSTDYVIFRLSNVYGNGDSGRVLPIFIHNALNGKPIQIYGNDKIIDFIHVLDTVEIIIKLMQYSNITINVGSGVGRNLFDIACLVNKYTNNKGIEILDSRKGEIDKYVTDVTEMFEVINYLPRIDFDKGLNEMIKVL